MEVRTKKITIISIIRYTIGLLFLFVGIVSLFDGEILPGVFSFLIGVILTPAIADPIENKIQMSLSAPLRVIAVFCLLIAMGATADPVEPTENIISDPIAPETLKVNNSMVESVAPETQEVKADTPKVKADSPESEVIETPEEVVTPEVIESPKEVVTPEASNDDAYEERLKEQEREEEEEPEKSTSTSSSASTMSSSDASVDALWISVASSDIKDVQSDMNGLNRAISNSDMASLTIYCDKLLTDTQTAINHNERYTVSSDLESAKNEYNLGMVAYNWAAVYCYAAIEADNSGDAAGCQDSLLQSADFLTKGSEHCVTSTDLLNDYTATHS